MNQTWQLRALAGYLLLGVPLAAACAREVNTLEEEEPQGSGGSASAGSGAAGKVGVGKGGTGTVSGAFGGTSSKGGGGGKPGVAGSSVGEGSDGPVAGSAGKTGSGGKGGTGASGGATGGVPPDVLARASVIVYYQTSHATPSDGTIQMKLFIENRSADPLPMANVELRYWFTAEVTNELHQYYTGPEAKQPQAAFVSAAASSHASMTFGGGSIAKGSDLNASEVQLEITSSVGKFDQSDDFSWQPGASTSTPNDKVTLYLDERLVWGCEPSGACADAAGGAGGAP